MMLLLLILQLLFLVFILIVDGEPFRFFLLRRFDLFSDLDLIQICLLDIYIGGFFFYVIALLPLQLFTSFFVLGFTIVCLLFVIATHFRALIRFTRLDKIRVSLTSKKSEKFLEYVVVLALFMIFLLINLASTSGLHFGSVRDESVHSLSVEVILENKQVPITFQPYVAEGIIYPQASHVIFAFATYVLNMEVPETVFYVTILFKSLTILGAYFLGKKVFARRAYYLGLSFVFTFVSSYPLYVTWGGNPFLVGFPLFLLCLGLLFPIVRNHGGKSTAELVTIGLLFGYCGAIIISYLETLIATGVLVGIYWLVRREKHLRRNLFGLLLVFLVSLLPLSPFLWRFLAFYGYPGHNIGIPSDFSGWPQQQFYIAQAFQWTFENLTPYNWLSLLVVSFFFGCAILIWITRAWKDAKLIAFALAIFTAAALLSFVSFFMPGDFTVISWGHQGVIMIVPINIIIVTFFVRLHDFCRRHKFRSFAKIFSKDAYSGALLAFLVLLLINVPFLYARFLLDPQAVGGAYSMYAITSGDDYELMLWMRANLSSAAIVLVNPHEAGLFIPAISHDRIIFPYTASSNSISYQTLVNLTLNHTLSDTTYELIRKYNITYVFVGEAATDWWVGDFKWDPYLFLGNPNFKVVKNFGNSYLFQFNFTLPNVAFLDDFQHDQWDDYGWRSYYDGNGLGNVTIGNSLGNDSRSLEITSQAVYSVSTWQYVEYVERKLFAPNNTDVALSFYLNATQGFHGKDTFAVVISNVYHNQSLIITTPNGVDQEYAHSLVLNATAGLFEFNGSLTNLWRQNYNSDLPSTLIMDLANYDFDGIRNVAYIGDISVTCTPPINTPGG